MKSLLTSLLVLLGAIQLIGQESPEGIWKSIDDKTGEEKSHIEIYQEDGKYYGKIVKLLQRAQDTVCEKCPGKKKDQKLVGMLIIEDLVSKGNYWKNGSILDPESGKEYGCSIWLEDGQSDILKVRGKHWTGLYRTQTWYRVN